MNNLTKSQAMRVLVDEWAEEIDTSDHEVKEQLLDIDIALRRLEVIYMGRELNGKKTSIDSKNS